MKKVLILILVICMVISLFACTSQETVAESAVETEATASVDLSNVTEDAALVVDEDYDGPVSLTTGLPVTEAVYHPVIVQVDNEATGRPQYGIQDADIVYESMIEGADTRLTCLFNDVLPEKVGPVRSARVYQQQLACEWDPIFVHQGGPFAKSFPRSYLYSEDNGNVFEVRLDGTKMGNSDAMWAQSASIEYCNPQAIIDEYDFERTQRDPLFTFDSDFDDASAKVVSEIQIPFLSNYDHYTYEYDAETDKFIRYRYGEEFIDATTNEAVSVQNIIVEYCKREELSNEGGRILMDVIGEGEAEFYIGGKHYTGTWEKEDTTSPTIYRFDNGEEITLKPGNTWIEIQPSSKYVITVYEDGTQEQLGD